MKKRVWKVAGIVGMLLSASITEAVTLPVYEGPTINWGASPACLGIGDGYGCSLPLLNYLAGKAPTADTSTGGYIIKTPQGALDPYIVLQAGGGAPDNTSPYGATAQVEDGFKSNDGGADSFRATGKTSTVLGNMNDPANNGLLPGADLPGTWDVGLSWLIDALSPSGVRRELMIGFDYNQTQNTTTSLNYWALVTVRDVNGVLADKNFEIRSDTGVSPLAWSTFKTIDSKPNASDFAIVNGVTCVDTNGSEGVPILPISGGQCPAGYELALNNAQSTATTEIAAFIPDLNSGLEGFLAEGYDTVSARMMFGCFGNASTGKKPGLGYLADDTQGTNNCENGGYADVFLMAGAPMNKVPEPGILGLMAVSLLGFVAATSRRKVRG